MAHIQKVTLKSGGTSFKAIVKSGTIAKTKTFKTKRDARIWANLLEADHERIEAYGNAGASVTFEQLIEEYKESDRKDLPAAHLNFWLDFFGANTKIMDIRKGDVIRGIEKRASMPAVRFIRGEKKSKDLGKCSPDS